jgi:hypothetical protein
MLGEVSARIPRIIWIMWLQGLAQAPDVVRKCYESWKKHNLGWQVIFLDEQTLQEYIDLRALIGEARQYISKQALSDIVRINLLAEYGGVWVDATCFACVPLDTWIDRHCESGFFAFRNPGVDRMLSSWFLASSRDCYLVSRWCTEVNRFIDKNDFVRQDNERAVTAVEWLAVLLNRNKHFARTWLLYLSTKVFKACPYFWFHYLFAGLYNKDRRFRQIWRSTPKVSAEFARKLRFSGLLKPISEKIKNDIDNRRDPLYKLTWHYDKNRYKGGCNLDYLLRSIDTSE